LDLSIRLVTISQEIIRIGGDFIPRVQSRHSWQKAFQNILAKTGIWNADRNAWSYLSLQLTRNMREGRGGSLHLEHEGEGKFEGETNLSRLIFPITGGHSGEFHIAGD